MAEEAKKSVSVRGALPVADRSRLWASTSESLAASHPAQSDSSLSSLPTGKEGRRSVTAPSHLLNATSPGF